MTPAQLFAALSTLLSDVLGTYKEGSVTRGKAIRVGEPPADYRASGLEVRITPDPDFANTPLQGNESNLAETLIVRVVAHAPGPSKVSQAVRRIVRSYSDASVATIPANEGLSILHQVVIRIPR